MVCIYCGGKTEVRNSRAQKRRNQIWRRRHCTSCEGVFTSIERANYEYALSFQDDSGKLAPFQRDALFLSIYDACGHRKAKLNDASALTETVMSKLMLHVTNGNVARESVVATVTATLAAFDHIAATYYRAYHPPKH